MEGDPEIKDAIENSIEKAECQDTIDPKIKEICELKDTLMRLQAEFENYKKRVDKEKSQIVKNAAKDVIEEILPIIDTFEMALKSVNDSKALDGLKRIYGQLYSVLEKKGLRKIEAVNKKFDPYYHEVLMQSHDNEIQDHQVIEEFQTGYMLNEHVIRTAKCRINVHINK